MEAVKAVLPVEDISSLINFGIVIGKDKGNLSIAPSQGITGDTDTLFSIVPIKVLKRNWIRNVGTGSLVWITIS